MPFRAAVVAFALLAQSVAAQDQAWLEEWFEVSNSATGTVSFLKGKDIATDPKVTATVWVKGDRQSDKTSKERGTMTQYYLDCPQRRYQILAHITYLPSGLIGQSGNWPFNKYQLEPVVPDSVGEVIFKRACGIK